MRSLVHSNVVRAVVAVAALAASPAIASALPPPELGPRAAAAGDTALRTAATAPGPMLVPPANDDLANAAAVAGLPYAASLDTSEATTAAGDPTCGGGNAASVWYAYTSPLSVWLTASTFGSGYDTTLAVYTGTPGALVEVACNDDDGGPQSRIAFPVSAGATYYVMAAGKTGGGALELALDVKPPLVQIGVRTTRAYEAEPAAGPRHIAWSEFPRRNGRAWKAYVRGPGLPRVALNHRGTSGFTGGFDGSMYVFQETRWKGNRPLSSDLVLYNLTKRKRSALPQGVNTRLWEWRATISGDWLLFGRRDLKKRIDLVILRNRTTGTSTVLERLRRGRYGSAEPGQVSGGYAVWDHCTIRCDVFLYDIAARTTTMIPNPSGRHQYSPSVTDDGTVYFVSSGSGCGASVRIERTPLGGVPVRLASLPRRHDSFATYALEHPNGATSVYFEKIHCKTVPWDIVKIVDP